MATLRIIENGDIDASRLNGSWAGAFGQTQFMPSTYQRLAVDLDGDGRRDIVDSAPDALGSTANFLKKAGWVPGLPWGFEGESAGRQSRPAAARPRSRCRAGRRPASPASTAGRSRATTQPG